MKPPSSIPFPLRFLFRLLSQKNNLRGHFGEGRAQHPRVLENLWTAGSPEKSTMPGFPEKSSVWTIHLHTLW